jgi:ABC-type transport system involved in cytochrome bd biosynthesis fused ATPase/permease subunit
MKYLPSVIQLIGSFLIVASVATINPLIAVILLGAFLVLFGIALENRGK